MGICKQCDAKVLPGESECKACGTPWADEGGTGDVDPMLGRTIAGNFEVLALLGEGAMGRVYRARQVSLDKAVAIKVLHSHLANDPRVAKRFHREARAASRLSHPGSIQIFDFGQDEDGTLYIAMELLDGDDLLTVIEADTPFSPRRILSILEQVLAALDAAHHADIIHRDLKPENVVVLEDARGREHVKVCDFGIAKIQEHEGGSAITVTGFVCGTPEYMAPEQARGEELDQRADVYAVGCVLYQMLTGEIPFAGDSALGIITKHLTERPKPPHERRPEWHIPARLEEVCLRAMRKDRAHRYATALAMTEALRAAVSSLGTTADMPLGKVRHATSVHSVTGRRRQARQRQRRVLWAAAAAALVGVLALWLTLTNRFPGTTVGTPPQRVVLRNAGAPSKRDAGSAQDGASEDSGAGATPAPLDGGRPSDTGASPPPPVTTRQEHAEAPSPTTPQIVQAPTLPPAPNPGQLAYDEGRRRFLANDVMGAIEEFELAARFMPRNAQVHRQLGRAHMRAGNVDRAAREYRRYLELSPDAEDRDIIERLIQRPTP